MRCQTKPANRTFMAAKTKAPITRRNQKPIPVAKMVATDRNRPVNSQQLADYLQVSTRTLAAWRADNKIPYWKINPRNFRYRITDVETALSLAR
jgi:DNA-binding transcriptional regulator YiaG